MDVRLIGEIAAGVGVVATVIWILLGVFGIRALRDVRDELRQRRGSR